MQNQFRDSYKKSIQKQQGRSFNEKVIALLEAGLDALKTFDGDSMFSTFLISERVFSDFELALLRKERWNQNLAVRKWTPIDVDMEFRGFVKNSQLTALSQYNYVAHFPRLVQMKDHIQNIITTFCTNVCIPKLKDKYSDFIIDFGLIGNDFSTVIVIELNEFMDTTDGCMFKWKQERKLLENGPFTFKIVDKPIPEEEQQKYLSAEWLKVTQEN